uniref:Putative cystatin n=1 Tax=Rhipicephalus microplus TaxID=6941 RepID=A0A6G5A9N7_RHIMP
MAYQLAILLSIFYGEVLCIGKHFKTNANQTGICRLRKMGSEYWYTIIADFVVSKQTNVSFYNAVLDVTMVCSSEEVDAFFELIFTIAPTYCNSRVPYDSRWCTPVTMEPIAKCIANVAGESPDKPRNVTQFACVAPEEPDSALIQLIRNYPAKRFPTSFRPKLVDIPGEIWL